MTHPTRHITARLLASRLVVVGREPPTFHVGFDLHYYLLPSVVRFLVHARVRAVTEPAGRDRPFQLVKISPRITGNRAKSSRTRFAREAEAQGNRLAFRSASQGRT